MAVNTTSFPAQSSRAHSNTERKTSGQKPSRRPTDDEILGLVTSIPGRGENDSATGAESATSANDASASGDVNNSGADGNPTRESVDAGASGGAKIPPELAPIFAAHPELRATWEAAQAYQSVFATPAAARDARQQLEELDALFFSAHPADQAALAARIHELSPEAFHGLAQAMQSHAAKVSANANASHGSNAASHVASAPAAHAATAGENPAGTQSVSQEMTSAATASGPSSGAEQIASPAANPAVSSPADSRQIEDPHRAAQAAFFHDTNAAAVEQILDAIHAQMNRLLPDSITANTRNRIVGEIYRELDATLRANRQLAKQLRETFQSGPRDAAHQHAIVTLVVGRARQALPAVAKRVVGEWTHSIVAANHERLGRHESASKRVDISGGGSSDGVNRKPLSPRDVNYRKLSDADILNL